MTNTARTDTAHTSESEEMYLITVARATEEGTSGPMPVAAIATRLDVSVASANEMVRKLAARGFVSYEPYHGVRLTTEGTKVADRVLRIRRLWATFLAEHLGFSATDADNQACELEHVTTASAAERLATFLGDPTSGPLGRRIPPTEAAVQPNSGTSVSVVPVGTAGRVVAVSAPPAIQAFLVAEGIEPGSELTVAASGESGVLIEVDEHSVHLDRKVAAMIEVVAQT
jgi:DtxR family Mn-dependent transcriptional regulator